MDLREELEKGEGFGKPGEPLMKPRLPQSEWKLPESQNVYSAWKYKNLGLKVCSMNNMNVFNVTEFYT